MASFTNLPVWGPENPVTVLIFGATGKQGGALVRELVRKPGYRVRALCRNLYTPSAIKLSGLGVDMRIGDLSQPESLVRAMDGVDVVYGMTTFTEKGAAAEVKHGIALAEACQQANVKHLIYSSTASAHKNLRIPHFDSKLIIEKYIEILRIPYTILAPVYFMDNLMEANILRGLAGGLLAAGLPAQHKLQQICAKDIAKFSALVIEQRARFYNKRIELAADELTGAEAAKILSGLLHKQITYVNLPASSLGLGNDNPNTRAGFDAMFEWFDRAGYDVDIAALRRDYPEVGWTDFTSFAREQDWKPFQGQSQEGGPVK